MRYADFIPTVSYDFTRVSVGYGKKSTSVTLLSYHIRREIYTYGYYHQCIPITYPNCFIR